MSVSPVLLLITRVVAKPYKDAAASGSCPASRLAAHGSGAGPKAQAETPS
jgi:hypothetical protein